MCIHSLMELINDTGLGVFEHDSAPFTLHLLLVTFYLTSDELTFFADLSAFDYESFRQFNKLHIQFLDTEYHKLLNLRLHIRNMAPSQIILSSKLSTVVVK